MLEKKQNLNVLSFLNLFLLVPYSPHAHIKNTYTPTTHDTRRDTKMPRCFMAKKLKYPYEQWKERQQESIGPVAVQQPMETEDEDDEIIDVVTDHQVKEEPLSMVMEHKGR